MTAQPQDIDYAKAIVAKLRRSKKTAAHKRGTARAAIAVGNYTDAAKEVFADFLQELAK